MQWVHVPMICETMHSGKTSSQQPGGDFGEPESQPEDVLGRTLLSSQGDCTIPRWGFPPGAALGRMRLQSGSVPCFVCELPRAAVSLPLVKISLMIFPCASSSSCCRFPLLSPQALPCLVLKSPLPTVESVCIVAGICWFSLGGSGLQAFLITFLLANLNTHLASLSVWWFLILPSEASAQSLSLVLSNNTGSHTVKLSREMIAHYTRPIRLGLLHMDDKAKAFLCLSLAFLYNKTARNRSRGIHCRITRYIVQDKHLSKILYKIK